MPRAVVEAGLADVVAPLHELPAALAQEVGAP
jgi:chemotaxis response regulator CheB